MRERQRRQELPQEYVSGTPLATLSLPRMPTPPRRFPAPWTVIETDGGYRVDDAKGQTIGWFYGEDEPSRRAAMNGLTRNEARRMTANFARLPELLKKAKPEG